MPTGTTRILIVFAVACLSLLMVFRFAEWRAGTIALERYCDAPENHLGYVRKILTEQQPAGEQSRRPFIVAAKLIYFIPQQAGESIESYLRRMEQRIDEACR
ncbi:MAG: hypothetical protein HOH04_10410 [Rhodospirillaceae bacterium]|nr:hypothetical protein [Rhodospirillaceae bacterium]